MENTVGTDSNSESDISDSWALIDEDSSLEWNNVMGISPHQHVFENNEVLRTCSSNELSDEDSIEVVADDHTDHLSDNEVQESNGEKWTMTENVKSKENITFEEDDIVPDVRHPPRQQLKKYTEYTPLLITILITSIVGGISVGYSWGSYASQPHAYESTAIQHTRALLSKLQNENLFLLNQLRMAHSSLKLAISEVPKFKDSMKLGVHKKLKEKSFDIDYSGLCTITDFILQSSLHSENVSKDFCLATDRPHQNEPVGTTNADKDNSTLSSAGLSVSNKHLEMANSSNMKVNDTEPNVSIAVDAKEVDKTSSVLSESASFMPLDGLLNEGLDNENTQHSSEHFGSEVNGDNVQSNESETDPRPYTKLRAIVENVYSILSIFGNDIQTAFPSKLELLNVLPQNLAALDFSMESFTSDNYEKMTAFKSQMQDTAQKLFDDIETSVNKLIHNIASKFKKFEMNSMKQACKLKRSLENSADIAHLDWNTIPIFQKCNEYQQSGNDDAMISRHRLKVNGPLSESKEEFVLSASMTPERMKPIHEHRVEEEQGPTYYDHNQKNENTKQTVAQNENFETKERSKLSHEKVSKEHKKSRKIKHDITENQKSKKYSDNQQQETNFKQKSKKDQDQTEREMRKKKEKDNKKSKMDDHVDFNHSKHEKYDKKKTFDNNQGKKFDKSNKEYKQLKKQKNIDIADEDNISGEWASKMAHARAEQRRRDHQSDWLFDRAESRKSSRGKNNKEPNWHSSQNYAGHLFTSDICNKTKTLKDQASKAWKDMKHRVKENVWRPIVDTAKTAKRAFNDLNKFHSHRE